MGIKRKNQLQKISRRNVLKGLIATSIFGVRLYPIPALAHAQSQGVPKLPKWPKSNSRIDTTLAHVLVTIDPVEFENIVGMPILLELNTNRIEGLQPSSSRLGGYDGTIYRGDMLIDGQMSRRSGPLVLTKDQVDFVKSYYPDFVATPDPSMNLQYEGIREFLRRCNPRQLVGAYITGSNCRDHVSPDWFPQEIINCHDITPLGHVSLNPTEKIDGIDEGRWFVDPRDTNNIVAYQDLLINAAIQHKVDFLFFDNMVRLSYRDFKTEDDIVMAKGFIAHIATLSKRLNAAGYRAVYNLGMLPYWPSRADPRFRAELENSFDTAVGKNGIYLETPFRFRDNSELTQWELDKLRDFLKRGACVCLAPYPGSYGDKASADWIAAISMFIRESGDSLFVSTGSYIDSRLNYWKDWPALYGKPVERGTFIKNDANNWYGTRRFLHGKITVVHVYVPWTNGTSFKALPVPTSEYHVVPGREPKRGRWDITSQTYIIDADPHLDSTHDDGHSDTFILGAKPSANGCFYQEIIAIDVIVQSMGWR